MARAPLAFAEGEIRILDLANTHTGEQLVADYFRAGEYCQPSLGKLDHVCRDHRTGDVHPLDRPLYDLLHTLAVMAGKEPRYEIISGYRSPASNAMLNANSSGVAKQSLHMQGKAIDVRLVGLSTATLRDLALELRAGGVGYYAKSNFVHLDTGRVRSWAG